MREIEDRGLGESLSFTTSGRSNNFLITTPLVVPSTPTGFIPCVELVAVFVGCDFLIE